MEDLVERSEAVESAEHGVDLRWVGVGFDFVEDDAFDDFGGHFDGSDLGGVSVGVREERSEREEGRWG